MLWTLHLAAPIQGQEYSYAHYDVRDGLAGSVVYHGAEDQEGFLWFATETGVSRFDGTHFRNFTTRDGLPDNEILRLYVDARNRVWMQPFGNAVSYYYQGKIHNQYNDSLLKQLRLTRDVIDMVPDAAGNMYIAENNAIHYVNFQAQKITRVLSSSGHRIIKIGLTVDGRLGYITNIDWLTGAYVKLNTQNYGVVSQSPVALGPIHRTWISPTLEIFNGGDSLNCIDPSTHRRLSSIYAPALKSVTHLDDSLLTINTPNGSTIYNFRTGRPLHECLYKVNVNTTMRDREGNYWFMTHGAGIYRMGSFEFLNYRFNPDYDHPLAVNSLLRTQKTLYVGTEKGFLYHIDSFRISPPVQLLGYKTFARIMNIQQQGDKLLFGTDQGVVLQKKEKLQVGKLPAAIKTIMPYKGKWLVSTNTGLFLLNDSLHFDHCLINQRATSGWALNDTFYMGSTTGLYQITGPNNTVNFLGNQLPVFKGRITAINATPDGTLWVATNGTGLIGYRNNRITHQFTEKEGLSSNICRALFIDNGYLWLGTDKGLNRISWQDAQPQITAYTMEDGLLANIVNCVYVDRSQVYVGTQAGLTVFDAEKISGNSICELRLTGITSADTSWHQDTLNFVLPARPNGIRFDYVGISFRSAGDITYRYRLKGLNDAWQTTRETYLSYPSLPSGEYELQIQATNKFGVTSALLTLPFRVDKLLWEKTWFRITVLLLAWLLVWLFVKARVRKVRQQNEEKMQLKNRMAELEQMALKAQMNPHFIFNSLNSVQQYVFHKDIVGANKFITEFSRLIRLTLDLSSRSRISIDEEVDYLSTYLELEKTKLEDKFTYTVEVSPELQTEHWYIPPMILQPYVENSVRHGIRNRRDKNGKITVSFSIDNTYLICRVEDNGVGRQQAGKYKSEMHIEYQSKGMTLTARRIEMLNKSHLQPVVITIEDLVENDTPAGTRVVLRFPLEDAGKSR